MMRWIQGFDFNKDGKNDAYVVHDLDAGGGGCLAVIAVALGFPVFCIAAFQLLSIWHRNAYGPPKTSATSWFLGVASFLIVFFVFIWLPTSFICGPSQTTRLLLGWTRPVLRVPLRLVIMLSRVMGGTALRGLTAVQSRALQFDAWLRRSTGQDGLYVVWAVFCYIMLPLMITIGVVVAAWS
jgi:hypothetical protein